MEDITKADEEFIEKGEPISHRTKNILIILLLLVIAGLVFVLIL
jgi:hypothetical protein